MWRTLQDGAAGRLADYMPTLEVSVLFLVMLLGCPTPDGCRESDAPLVELGFGETGFDPIPDNQEVAMVFGTQGGYHLPLAIDAEGLATGELVVGSFTGTIEGQEVARSNPWLTFRCNPATETQQAWNIQLIFDMGNTPEDLVGKTMQITGDLRDDRQITVPFEGEVVIVEAP